MAIIFYMIGPRKFIKFLIKFYTGISCSTSPHSCSVSVPRGPCKGRATRQMVKRPPNGWNKKFPTSLIHLQKSSQQLYGVGLKGVFKTDVNCQNFCCHNCGIKLRTNIKCAQVNKYNKIYSNDLFKAGFRLLTLSGLEAALVFISLLLFIFWVT